MRNHFRHVGGATGEIQNHRVVVVCRNAVQCARHMVQRVRHIHIGYQLNILVADGFFDFIHNITVIKRDDVFHIGRFDSEFDIVRL